ncbi:MAG: NAD(P)/FAD-dependent oxidoreductase [Deltaproteobacteria bacterium]|nr:NAD(P)/FAD-dependent oxidoreductase [Deltaproteobacteria bacterium]
MSNPWDVIVVGARCSGATLATHLARSGVRTLLLEASPRGADHPMSTHYVQPPGIDALDRLGLGDRVRAVTPAARNIRLALDDVEFLSAQPEGRFGRCVRRSTLDPWLQEAAETAGAELRDRHRVVDVLREGERVTGVVAETASGKVELRADLVVGADGPHSIVARRVGAEAYLEHTSDRGGYFFYVPAPPRWEHPWDATLEHRGEDIRYVFRCDGDVLCMISVAPIREAQSWGKNWRERTIAHLMASPTTARLLEGKEPIGKGAGLLAPHFFYRRPVGPGWALVGDAGHFKDYVTGMGMTDAFEDAERLARAIIDGRPGAFDVFWRERDAKSLPLHFDALRQGAVGCNAPFFRWVIANMQRDPELAKRPGLVSDRKLDPHEMIPVGRLLGWMGRAALRGRLDVLQGFFQQGKVMGAERREITARRALHAEAVARLAAQAPRELATAAE